MIKFTCVLFVLAIEFSLIHSPAMCQVPARSNFNVVFENNFNDDILGRYQVSDYLQDFSPLPVTIPEQNRMDIIRDTDPRYDKFMRGYYPKGTLLPDQHGYLFMSYLDNPVNELYFSFDVRFKDGFQWVKGGKLPGLTGGKIVSGVKPSATDGFSTRMMWKENGRLVFYVYHQNQSIIYGDTYFWGNFAFTTAKWYNLSIRVVLNTFVNGVAQSNGILEGFVDGKLLFQKGGFKFRSLESIKIDDLFICTFFGGNTSDFAAIRDEWMDIDNFVAFSYSNTAQNVPRGNQFSSASTTLLHPFYSFGAPVTVSLPSAPTSLTAASVSSTSASIRWTDNCINESGFKIEYCANTSSTYTEIGSVGSNTSTFTHNGLTPGTIYHYRVKAWNAAGSSSYSNILDVTTPSATSSATGLLSHYTFENSTTDVTGNGHNGVLKSGATYSSIKSAQGTSSLYLGGIDEYVDLGLYNLGTQFTFATWVYIPSGSTNIRTIFANAQSGSKSNGFKIMVNTYGTTDRKIIVETGNGTTSSSAMTASSVYIFDRWNHIAVTINKSTGIARIYLNGKDVTANSAILPSFSTYQNTRLGTMSNGIYCLRGYMDDTRIYNKILTASEISALTTLASLKEADSVNSVGVFLPAEQNISTPVIYPNPFTDRFTIKSSEKISGYEIYNLQGAKLFEQREIDLNEITLSEAFNSDFVLFVKVFLINKEVHTLKILRNK